MICRDGCCRNPTSSGSRGAGGESEGGGDDVDITNDNEMLDAHVPAIDYLHGERGRGGI